MALPVVAIVGRPNVGKSSLLAFLSRQMVSIIEPTAGVTRDRVSTICSIDDQYFELVDTGGFGIVDHDDLGDHVERQIHYAIEQASLILFVCDARDGIMPLDHEVARLLRRRTERTILLVNKVDEPMLEPEAAVFVRLGYGQPIEISALHYRGRAALEEAIVDRLGESMGEKPTEPVMKVAIVGRRNVGKSTFINSLAGEERVIVSEIAGTTRDAVDVRFDWDGRTFVAIDTAGVRKKSRMADSIEFFGYTRVERSIRRADVVLFMVDAISPISDVDKKLCSLITEEYKPCVIVVNKWDLAKSQASTEDFGDYFDEALHQLDYAPIVFTTAIDAHNVTAAIDTASSLFKQTRERVTTSKLNAALSDVLALRGPSAKRGRKSPKIYYATQISAAPPSIVLFVNSPGLIRSDYERFLLSRLRERLPFEEIPIRLIYRARRSED